MPIGIQKMGFLCSCSPLTYEMIYMRNAMAAAAAGADGLIIEVHNDPPHAKCDGPQSITPEMFDSLAPKLFTIHDLV